MYLNTVFKYNVFKYCPALLAIQKKFTIQELEWKLSFHITSNMRKYHSTLRATCQKNHSTLLFHIIDYSIT